MVSMESTSGRMMSVIKSAGSKLSNSSTASLGDPNYVRSVYDQFLTLQASRELITVFTGKRVYQNMLIRRLHTMTNKDTENSMILDCEMTEIILTTTQTVTVPPASSMANPQDNAATTNGGQKSLTPGSNFNDSQALADGTAPI